MCHTQRPQRLACDEGRKWGRNDTLVYDHDHFHYVSPALEEKTDLTINDTAELSHIRNFEESSLNGENGKENIWNDEKEMILKYQHYSI
ncbi:hypothetical protein CEXT_271941 [Caerostris extrusa]|uniref:Uncharacterized protein n=1 Tax=Caerostris extrusa TaxID=172846 RepID=A0AAV4NM84_CAEEX|nr:hypothetical protein CEXT_271941 [Caerostris extrusa]